MLEFALLHVIYLALVVGLPAAGLVILVRSFRPRSSALMENQRRWPRRTLAVFALGLAPLGYYASYVEPFRLTIERADIEIPVGRAGRAELRIGVLADLQTDRVTDHEKRAVDLLLTQQPDLILLPGDFFQGSPEAFQRELPQFQVLLARLTAPAGVFCVSGNVDRREDIHALLAGASHIRWLDNEIVEIAWQDRRITIGGVFSRGVGGSSLVMQRLETRGGTGDIRILLTHYPDRVLNLRPQTRIDLVVAGHTHGGQLQLPLIGPLLTFSRLPPRIAGGGLHDLSGRKLFISRGVGWERNPAPRLRFLCPPDVGLLTLQSSRHNGD